MGYQRAHIKPELLVWGREQSGLSMPAAAAKLQVSQERLGAWERGDEEPTIGQLRNAARVYHRRPGSTSRSATIGDFPPWASRW